VGSDARAATTTIGGLAARWDVIDVVVEDDELGPLPARRVELYLLAEPESAIDAGALLRERVIADPPYWALVWTGARAIAAVLMQGPSPHTSGAQTPDLVRAAAAALPQGRLTEGLRVLDLGCGLGLSGLAAANIGARVVFGDYLEQPLAFVRASLARRADEARTPARQASGVHEVRRIDFTRDRLGERFDLILAADIVYDPAHYAALAEFLDLHLAGDGAILLTESLRADARVFLDGLCGRGFDDARRCLWVFEEGRRERTWLHTLTRRQR